MISLLILLLVMELHFYLTSVWVFTGGIIGELGTHSLHDKPWD